MAKKITNKSCEKILNGLKTYLPLDEWKEDIKKTSEEQIKKLPIKDIIRNFSSSCSPSSKEILIFQQALKRLINYHIPQNIHYLLKKDEDGFLLKQILLAERDVNKRTIEEKEMVKEKEADEEMEPESKEPFFGKIPKELWKDKTINWSAKCQYAVYHNFCMPKNLSEKPECTIGVTRMAFEMNLKKAQIKRNDRQLKRGGWIKKISHGKGKTSNTVLMGKKFYPVKVHYEDDGTGVLTVKLEVIDREQHDLSVKYYKEQDEKELKKFKKSEENVES